MAPEPPVPPEGPETAWGPVLESESAEPVVPELSDVEPAAVEPPVEPDEAVGVAVTPEPPPLPPPALAVLRLVPPMAVPLTGPPPMAMARLVALPAVPP